MKPISASQVKTAIMCYRRWGFEQLEGKRPPPSPAMLKGLALHKTAEKYLKGEDATKDEYWPYVRMAIKHLPSPGSVRVEERFDTEIYGITYTGYVDFAGPEGFGDHKTCSSFDWAQNDVYAALKDPQYLLYATVLEEPRGKWVYYRWKKEGKRPVKAAVESYQWDPRGEAITRAFDTIVHPVAERLVKIREKGLTVSQLPPNLKSCGKYPPEGCPHASYCNHKEFRMSDDLMSLFGEVSKAIAVPSTAPSRGNPPMPPPIAGDIMNPPEAFQKAFGTAPEFPVPPSTTTSLDEAIEAAGPTNPLQAPLLRPATPNPLSTAHSLLSLCIAHGLAEEAVAALKPIARKALGE